MPPSLDDLTRSARANTESLSGLELLPPVVHDQIEALLANSADRRRAEHYVSEFYTSHPSNLLQLAAGRSRVQWLITVFSSSRFLSEELVQRPEWLNDVPDVY